MATRDDLRSAFFALSTLIGRVVAVESTHYRGAITLLSGTLTGVELIEGAQSIHIFLDHREHQLSRKSGRILVSAAVPKDGGVVFREVFSGIDAIEPAMPKNLKSGESSKEDLAE